LCPYTSLIKRVGHYLVWIEEKSSKGTPRVLVKEIEPPYDLIVIGTFEDEMLFQINP